MIYISQYVDEDTGEETVHAIIFLVTITPKFIGEPPPKVVPGISKKR